MVNLNKSFSIVVLTVTGLLGCGKTSFTSKRTNLSEPNKNVQVEDADGEGLSLKVDVDTDVAQDGCFNILPVSSFNANNLSLNKALTQEQGGVVTAKTLNKANANQIFMLTRKADGSFVIHTRGAFQALTASADPTKRGSVVKPTPIGSNPNQQFVFTAMNVGTQRSYLIAIKGSNQTLDINEAISTMIQWDSHRGANQRFLLNKTECK